MSGTQTLMLAHRGALEERTENTMPAFERALELGADGVELDVRATADGEVVVFHDRDLRRMAGRPEVIAATAWKDLRGVVLPGATGIPRLSELLASWPAERWLDVEIKRSPNPTVLVDATVELLADRPHTLLSSFDPRLLARARERGWTHETALLLEPISPAFLHAAGGREWGAQGVILDATICSQAVIERYRGLGYDVGFYGARDREHEADLVALGVRWWITDWPRAR